MEQKRLVVQSAWRLLAMPVPLPEGFTVLPVAGRESSIAYLVRYESKEVGKVERSSNVEDLGDRAWKYWGQGLLCYVKGDAPDLKTALERIFYAVEKVIKGSSSKKKKTTF